VIPKQQKGGEEAIMKPASPQFNVKKMTTIMDIPHRFPVTACLLQWTRQPLRRKPHLLGKEGRWKGWKQTLLKMTWREISKTTKFGMFKIIVKSVLFYVCEIWKCTKHIFQSLQTFINRC
jgi:hypothetical protein